jgi:hypothetical protein
MDFPPPPSPESFPPPPTSLPVPRRRRRGPWLEIGIALALALIVTIGSVIAVPLTRGGEYAFLDTRPDGSPVRWNPCRPIHYVTNLKLAPDSAFSDVRSAILRISEATGIRFVDDGPSSMLPTQRDSLLESVGTDPGEEWAPVLIAWVDNEEFARLGGDSSKAALAAPIAGPDHFYVSGFVAVNADEHLLPGFGIGPTWGPVLLHELGHIVGLGHVRSTSELMYPQENPVMNDFGRGDLEGFRLLGRSAGCPSVSASPAA